MQKLWSSFLSYGTGLLVIPFTVAFAQDLSQVLGEEPTKWKMLDCVTAQGPFDQLLITQKELPAIIEEGQNGDQVLVQVNIDSKITGSVYLEKSQFDLMQASGEFLTKIDLNYEDGSKKLFEIKLSYGREGVFFGVLRDLQDASADRVACDEP